LRWSVSLQTEGDRVIELDEVVELADAVAASDGIASGMGTYGYGVQIVVEAEHSDRAVELAMAVLAKAVEKSGLPSWPVVSVETIAEDEEMFHGMVED
jgi:hypothetical protein